MKTASWICWLLATCVCISEAKNKIRRPSSPPYAPTLILKKPRPINHRISMGNTIHIGAPSRQRIQPHPYKHINYRIRRPTTMYNVLSNTWKNQIPTRAFLLNSHAILPQRSTPTKDFYSINKVQEYNSQYKPDLAILPPTHRGDIDDDKGPIHTIPAPNLSPADKPYNSPIDSDKIVHYRPYLNDLNTMNDYHTTMQNSMTTTFGLAAINGSFPLQRTATNSSPLLQHQYEVTESNNVEQTLNEHQTIQPETTRQPQDLDVTRLYSIIINNPHQSSQSNELSVNHAVNSNAGSNVQFDQSNMPMQTNLHSSLHVGFPSTAIQTPYTVAHQIPADFYIGHPVVAGSPLSATQLYDLLNNVPHKLAEQYTSDQQHILQPQLGQMFQPDVTSFSQPQMHSFNYNEQGANQIQQQQILPDQGYASESVTADYNLGLESSTGTHKQNDVHVNEEFTYSIDRIEQYENNLDDKETTYQVNPTISHFDEVADNSVISAKFYTTLPNREAAEKLAALAAAGHVNSHLIDQLQKQQKNDTQKNSMPFNHKNDDLANQQQIDNNEQMYNQQKSYRKAQHHHKPSFKVQNNEKLSLQIMIPDEKSDYVTSDDHQQGNIKSDNMDIEYEYEDGEIEDSQSTLFKMASHDNNFDHAEFGTRLSS